METSNTGVIESVKDGVVNTVKGAGNVTSAAVDVIGQTAGSAVKSAAEVAGDIGTATKNLVGGAVEGAKELGVDAMKAVSTTATEALKAAGEIGSEAGEKVRDTFTGTIAGAKVVLNEPFKKLDG